MSMRDIAGFFLLPLALLAAAWTISEASLWSALGNLTIPWFCSALGLAVLVVGVTCLLLQQPPAAISMGYAFGVIVGVLLIVGIGLLVDLFAYDQTADWLASLGEWFGFAVILCGVFCLARRGAPATGADRRSRPADAKEDS